MAKLIDLTGQRFDKLVVLEKAPSRNRHVYWKCQCDCGNIIDKSGEFLRSKASTIKDCGCSKQEEKKKKELLKKQKREYLVGKRFGKLTVIGLIEDKRINGSLVWKCQCDCGNIKEVPTHLLTTGHTQSCGCLVREVQGIDITNQKFGKLIALYPIEDKGNRSTIKWHCKCECGNEINVDGTSLRRGLTTSCGCINYSIGEKNIEKILKDNNINFISQYTNSFLQKKRFDFALMDQQDNILRLIEFDGEQHYSPRKGYWNSKSPEQDYQELKIRDKIKNQWCKNNNIPLVRIPYWERNNITLDMILGDQYLIK